jgi:predicted DNA binding CopG/RHH family protein
MPRKHVQARVPEEDYKKIKKKAIDLGITMEEFLSISVTEKLNKDEEGERDTTDKG